MGCLTKTLHPSAPRSAPLSLFITHCGTPVKQFADPCASCSLVLLRLGEMVTGRHSDELIGKSSQNLVGVMEKETGCQCQADRLYTALEFIYFLFILTPCGCIFFSFFSSGFSFNFIQFIFLFSSFFVVSSFQQGFYLFHFILHC